MQPAGSAEAKCALVAFPNDDCTAYDHERAAEGWPRATLTSMGDDGKEKKYKEGGTFLQFGRSHDCRHCSIWRARNGQRLLQGMTEDEKLGKHNPKTCPRLAKTLLNMPGGSEFVQVNPPPFVPRNR